MRWFRAGCRPLSLFNEGGVNTVTHPTKNHPLGRFPRGFFYPFRAGLFLLKHPRLLKFAAIPLLINIIVFSTAVYFGLNFFNYHVIHYLPQGQGWYWALLYYLFWVVALIATGVLVFFSFSVVGNLIASPFNDVLSERTEEMLGGIQEKERFSLKAFGRESWRILVEESKKMAFFVAGMVLLFLLNLIPGVGTVLYAGLSILFTLFFLAVEYTGYVFVRKKLRFRDQRRFIFSRLVLMSGFGTGVLLLLAIPFLQFICIPAAVVGATQLWFDEASGGSAVGNAAYYAQMGSPHPSAAEKKP